MLIKILKIKGDVSYESYSSRQRYEIVIMSEVGSQKLDSKEVFEEIISLLHCYSMKLYSKRKISRFKQVLEEKE